MLPGTNSEYILPANLCVNLHTAYRLNYTVHVRNTNTKLGSIVQATLPSLTVYMCMWFIQHCMLRYRYFISTGHCIHTFVSVYGQRQPLLAHGSCGGDQLVFIATVAGNTPQT